MIEWVGLVFNCLEQVVQCIIKNTVTLLLIYMFLYENVIIELKVLPLLKSKVFSFSTTI